MSSQTVSRRGSKEKHDTSKLFEIPWFKRVDCRRNASKFPKNTDKSITVLKMQHVSLVGYLKWRLFVLVKMFLAPQVFL